MERRSGLRFEPGPIVVNVFEGTSYSGPPGRLEEILKQYRK